jgi:hypothetical protein
MIAQAPSVVTKISISVIIRLNAHVVDLSMSRHASVAKIYARVVELVDTLALGASAFGREGSSPFARTKSKSRSAGLLFDLEKYMI